PEPGAPPSATAAPSIASLTGDKSATLIAARFACEDGCHAVRDTVRSAGMTYVVNENCIKCKYMDCVEVCPVDCFYEGANMLVIHPDECIDCGVCEPECPAEAIKPDTE